MLEVAAAVQQGFSEGVLQQRPTLVNLQCDIDHPTQSMADMLHLIHYFGGVENLKGKKLAMSWAYSPSYGKAAVGTARDDRLDDTVRHGRGPGPSQGL